MKWIKTFEAWAGQPLPTTSLNVELEYKNCKDCNAGEAEETIEELDNKPRRLH